MNIDIYREFINTKVEELKQEMKKSKRYHRSSIIGQLLAYQEMLKFLCDSNIEL